MVYRIFVEKKPELANEARSLAGDLRDILGIKGIESLRIFNRYDVENITPELFDYARHTVFSEPQLDIVTDELPESKGSAFAVEYLPGQFDQRADSAGQCIRIISPESEPRVKTATVYLIEGEVSSEELSKIKSYVINPVEAREASSEKPATLADDYAAPAPVAVLEGFRELDEDGLAQFVSENGLAMDRDDLRFCREYFKAEQRDPTITEIRMIDTYWSDHCRHTTFNTIIDNVEFSDPLLQAAFEDYQQVRRELKREKPVTLMDIGTIAAKLLKKNGMLDKLDESEEINACTVKIEVDIDGEREPWLLLFKNETHNHPTEIEPFGGAATCIGGAIRDPLSGRGYVYAAMRLTGGADPLRPMEETIPGKLPQRKLVTTAAAGYSSYGNQIGLATGQVDELYHDGYAAKRMEIGAVIAAVPEKNVRRERPIPGDVVILLGGKTGRDGCGGATGSSKSHTAQSLETCGAEVQKGNPPEERKLQRLFRNPEASLLIKRCNDFGAGGVSVAIGELADGLRIWLERVPKKYEGLDGTELAISESQERMAVVVSADDAKRFLELADAENLEATVVAEVTENPRLVMSLNGDTIVDVSREFLDSNGAEKHISAAPAATEGVKVLEKPVPSDFAEGYKALAQDLNVCSRRGLSEMFDSTIGAGTVLMPFGGKRQLTPIQAMVHKISIDRGDTDTCSFMAWGYNPFISEKSPYHGAYLAVVESVSKLVASGAEFKDVYLSFQEYFEKLGSDPKRWGKPLAALLGAFKAQVGLGVAAIGGKDSMSGSFEDMHVPPTLVSFAVTTGKIPEVVSPEFKSAGSSVWLLLPEYDENGLPTAESLKENFKKLNELVAQGKVRAAYTPGFGGIAEAVMKMCLGNNLGFRYEDGTALEELFGYSYGAFVLELCDGAELGKKLGVVTAGEKIELDGQSVELSDILELYEGKLESVYACNIQTPDEKPESFSFRAESRTAPRVKSAKPRFLIPVFPGTNCEDDSARAVERAGGEAEIFVVRNLSGRAMLETIERFTESVNKSQAIFIPGGFSGGDEPDGSGKFITAFFRNELIKNAVNSLLDERDGLICGICNGFQALIKLGLVPYGSICDTDENSPTLTFNTIGRHQSRQVRTRVCSNKSPWLSLCEPGEIYTVPISHGEGRFYASEAQVKALAENGQIATQYVDENGEPTYDIHFNPNGSVLAVEGICSPDGRVFGKMGHSERIGKGLYKNVPGEYDIRMFEAAVKYFK